MSCEPGACERLDHPSLEEDSMIIRAPPILADDKKG